MASRVLPTLGVIRRLLTRGSVDLAAGTTLDGQEIATGSGGAGPVTLCVTIPTADATPYIPALIRTPITGTVTGVWFGATAWDGMDPVAPGTLVASVLNVSEGEDYIAGENLTGLTPKTILSATLTNTAVTAGDILSCEITCGESVTLPVVVSVTIEITPA